MAYQGLFCALVVLCQDAPAEPRTDVGRPDSSDPVLIREELVLPIRFLLNDPLIQEEIELPVQTRRAVAQMTVTYLKDNRKARDELDREIRKVSSGGPGIGKRNGTESDGDKRQRLVREHFAKQKIVVRDFEANLLRILDDKQCARLCQLNLQLDGVSSLLAPSVSEQVGLSSDQVVTLKAIRDREQLELQSLRRKEGRDKNGKPMDASRAAQIEKSKLGEGLSLLSQAQKTRFEALLGRPISFTRFDLRKELNLRNLDTIASREN